MCVLTYAIIYVLMHQIIFRFYLLKHSLFFKYSCTNIFHRRSLYTFYSMTTFGFPFVQRKKSLCLLAHTIHSNLVPGHSFSYQVHVLVIWLHRLRSGCNECMSFCFGESLDAENKTNDNIFFAVLGLYYWKFNYLHYKKDAFIVIVYTIIH